MADITLSVEFADAAFSDMHAIWGEIWHDDRADDRLEQFRRDPTKWPFPRACPKPEQISRGTTAKSCTGLTLAASDGERLGRFAWLPGANA